MQVSHWACAGTPVIGISGEGVHQSVHRIIDLASTDFWRLAVHDHQ